MSKSKFPGLFAPPIPTIGFNHLPYVDANVLHFHQHALMRGVCELLIRIGGDAIEESFEEVTPTTRKLLQDLRDAGYAYVRFSTAHTTYPDIWPVFSW
jgi:hypothetical protein